MDVQIHRRTCHLCEAMCGIEIHHQGADITAIKGDKNDPFSHGHICPKAVALQDLHQDPQRLRHPMKRTDQGWQPISWSQALTEASQRIQDIQKRYGRSAVGVYAGNPTVHSHGSTLAYPWLLKTLRTRNHFSATSVDQMPHMLASYKLFGHQLLLPVPDLDRCHYFLCIGGNPVASNGSIMSSPDIPHRLKRIANRGQVVVVDPRRTETAALASQYHAIKPSTDTFLLLGLLNHLFATDQVNLGSASTYCKNLDQLRQLVQPYTPDWASRRTGIRSSQIKAIANDFAQAPAAVAYCRMGSCTSRYGTLAAWLTYVLNIVTGNFDQAGGIMFPLPAIDTALLTAAMGNSGSLGRWHSRVRKFPEFSGELPASVMAEEILTPGKGQIRGFITHAGNPVLSTPNGAQLDQAFSQLDFMLSIDFYINETTRHAHIILPPNGPLERNQFDLIFQSLAIRNTSNYSPALYPHSEGTRPDWQILLELSARLKLPKWGQPAWLKLLQTSLRYGQERWLLDTLIRLGPYGDLHHQGHAWLQKLNKIPGQAAIKRLAEPLLSTLQQQLKYQPKLFDIWQHSRQLAQASDHAGTLNLAYLRDQTHATDLGPLQPCMPQRLFTDNKKIDLVPSFYRHEMARLAQEVEQPQKYNRRYPLKLIGRRQLRSNNSWMHNSHRLVKGKPQCTLLIHPKDAEKLKISEGSSVAVTSRVGSITLPAQVDDSILPGVVCMPHGWGHGRDGVQQSTAQRVAGVSQNDLTDEQACDPITGMAVLNGLPVRVEPASPAT